MKIAILSDIHGNLPALDAVLADIGQHGADLVVNLGDICSGPLYPVETADRLMALGLPTIRGNHERQLLEQPRSEMNASDRYAAERLRPDQMGWLASLPETLLLPDNVLLVHGTPASDIEALLQTVDADGMRAATPAEVTERTQGHRAAVILCGHTHVPAQMHLGDQLVLNPGSVGLPAYCDALPFPHVAETGTPHAKYAIAMRTDAGWTVQFRRVAYDWEAAAKVAEANERMDWAGALRTGRA